MMITHPNEDFDAFLRKVRQGLASLPTAEREDIIAELRSHLLGRQGQGNPDPLAGFEPPEKLAADFVAEHALRGALAEGTAWAMGKALFIAARDSVLGLLVLLPLLLLQVSALCLLLTAALKPFIPDKMGLWTGDGNFYVGAGRGNPAVHEVLGWWGMPVLAAAGVLLFWLSNRGMMALVRWRLRSRQVSHN
jgi:hypothetical protein